MGKATATASQRAALTSHQTIDVPPISAAVSGIFLEAAVPAYFRVIAEETSPGLLSLGALFFSRSNLPTIAIGFLRFQVQGQIDCFPVIRSEVKAADFGKDGKTGTLMLKLPAIRLEPGPCAEAEMLAVSASFLPRRAQGYDTFWLADGQNLFRPWKGRARNQEAEPPARPRQPLRPTPRTALGATIEQVITEHMDKIRGCYERLLLGDPQLATTIVIDWSIRSSGSVTSVRKVSSSVENKKLANCLIGEIRTWRFPPGKATSVRYPFAFQPLQL